MGALSAALHMRESTDTSRLSRPCEEMETGFLLNGPHDQQIYMDGKEIG